MIGFSKILSSIHTIVSAANIKSSEYFYKTDLLYGETTNNGMNQEISMDKLVHLIVEMLDAEVEIVSD